MRILLTGAEGFTGRHFTERALAEGNSVIALQSDLTDSDALRQEVSEASPDAVVHLAAISFVGHADEKAFYGVNVVGTTNLLDALTKLPTPPHRVLLASSANIYGNTAHSPISETQPAAPVNHYATSKLAMECMARTYEDRLNLIITRPFNYTGPGQDVNFLIPKLAMHFAARAPSIALGNLHVEREFNDVRMVCNAYLFLLAYGEPGGIYNVCSGQPYELQHVIDSFTQITGYKMEVSVNPAFVRGNEVHRLCGNPAKLNALLTRYGAKLEAPTLEETLRRMLAALDGGTATAKVLG